MSEFEVFLVIFLPVIGFVHAWKMVFIDRTGFRGLLPYLFFFFLIVALAIPMNIYRNSSGQVQWSPFAVLFMCFVAMASYTIFRFINWAKSGPKIGERSVEHKSGRLVNVNITNIKNDIHVNVMQISYNTSVNILGLQSGFGKRELKRAKKEKLGIVKQERKKIGFFDKDGKIENKNKVERIEQSYKNLLEHVK